MKYTVLMKRFKGVVLTDHRSHSDQNSVYALTAALVKHPQVEELYIVSRYNDQNKAFFETSTTNVQAVKATDNFQFDPSGQQFYQQTITLDLTTVDFVFLRLPRPVSDAFLEYLQMTLPKAVFVNHPKGIIQTSNKAFLLEVSQWCPPIQLCRSAAAIRAFAQQFPIVLKPLREYGGKGIVRVENNQVYTGKSASPFALEHYLETIAPSLEEEGCLAMQFLKNVDQGDKRILVVGGQIMGCSLRLPAKGSWLCNVAQGGQSVATTLTPEEDQMVQNLAPQLLKKGVLIFGMDTLVNDEGQRVLSEINTLSVGGFPQAEAQSGQPILNQTAAAIVQYIRHQHAQR